MLFFLLEKQRLAVILQSMLIIGHLSICEIIPLCLVVLWIRNDFFRIRILLLSWFRIRIRIPDPVPVLDATLIFSNIHS
jgi:hypothetical protein